MTIDKFGSHVQRQLKKVDTDKTLTKSDTGAFDVKLTRLKGLRRPESSDEAVNKQYVDELFQNYYSKPEIQLEFQNIRKQLQVIISKIE